jgi:hypothetical protein
MRVVTAEIIQLDALGVPAITGAQHLESPIFIEAVVAQDNQPTVTSADVVYAGHWRALRILVAMSSSFDTFSVPFGRRAASLASTLAFFGKIDSRSNARLIRATVRGLHSGNSSRRIGWRT